ncbi:MAG: LamG domain-containing protein [Euryarchaeota archaeon]|nr:LamG domain-containing protein [Euryarchaeota archaeon]
MSLSRGLVGHWSLDEESYNPATKRFTDKSAYNNHGTSANAASFVADRMGQADRAMDFNRSSDYVDCGNGDSLDITDEITIAVWVKLNNLPQYQRVVSRQYNGINTANSIFQLGMVNAGVNKGFRWSVGNTFDHWDGTPQTNIWYHVVGTYNKVTAELYVDNDKLWSDNFTDPIRVSNVEPLIIGAQSYLGNLDHYTDGSLADVRIYNRVLSEAEITLLYESYRPKTIIA